MVLEEEHTASRRKLKNFTGKRDLNKNEYDAFGVRT
jgi:hypothetical protein